MGTRIILICLLLLLPGCQCFRVCPDAPKPPKIDPMPILCYKQLREYDDIGVILKCYLTDILLLEKAAKERDKALGAYQ